MKEDIEKDLAADAGYTSAAYAEAIVTHIQIVHPDFWSWEQSKRRLGFGLGIITAILTGVGLFYLLAIVIQIPGGNNWGRAIAGVCFIAFLLPYGLITRRGAEHFKAQWLEQGKTATPTFSREVDSTAIEIDLATDDNAIIYLASTLTSQLHIPNLKITNVVWKTLVSQGRGFDRVPSDGVLFRGDTVYLAENMKGKLSPDEWKPLIASAMINSRKLKPQKTRMILTMTLPTIAIYIAAWFILPPLFPTTSSCASNGQCAVNNVGWDILVVLGLVLPIVLIISGLILMRKFSFVADQKTVESLGKAGLISSLQKVIKVSPGDSQSAQSRIDRLSK